VLPDRIETGTFLVAGAMTGGRVLLKKTRRHARRGAAKLEQAGAASMSPRTTIELDMRGKRPKCGIRHHRAVSGLPDRHAGAVHGAEHAWPKASA
jgi:UDP-N-acetylglucosamine enolpyruvyl transferase